MQADAPVPGIIARARPSANRSALVISAKTSRDDRAERARFGTACGAPSRSGEGRKESSSRQFLAGAWPIRTLLAAAAFAACLIAAGSAHAAPSLFGDYSVPLETVRSQSPLHRLESLASHNHCPWRRPAGQLAPIISFYYRHDISQQQN